MFLSNEELKSVAPTDIINLITDNDNEIVTTIIEETIDIIRNYIPSVYDVDWLFSLTGNNRKKSLLKYAKNIAIYDIYCRRGKMVNETIEKQYAEAMRFLERLSEGKIKPKGWIKPPEEPEEENDEDSPYLFTHGKPKYHTGF